MVGSSLIVKNWVVFGWPTNGTLEGLNLNRMSIAFLTPRDRKKMIRSGQLSVESQSEFPCVNAARNYPNAGPSVRNGALDRAWRKSDHHIPSWNYHSFVQCLRVLRYDAVLVIQKHPYAYFKAVQRSVPIAYYSATPDVRVRQANQRALRTPARVEAFALGGLGVAPNVYDQFRTFGTWLPYREEWVVVVAGLLCLLGLPWAALSSRRRGNPARTMVAAFAWVVIVTTHVLTQLAETGENNRFRFTSDPVLLVGTVLVILSIRTALPCAWGRRRRGRPRARGHRPGSARCRRRAATRVRARLVRTRRIPVLDHRGGREVAVATERPGTRRGRARATSRCWEGCCSSAPSTTWAGPASTPRSSTTGGNSRTTPSSPTTSCPRPGTSTPSPRCTSSSWGSCSSSRRSPTASPSRCFGSGSPPCSGSGPVACWSCCTSRNGWPWWRRS